MLVISPQQPCGIGRYSLVSGNSPMRASDPTNHLQCLPQSIKVFPRRDEGIPPYRLLALPAAYCKKLCRERLISVQEPNQRSGWPLKFDCGRSDLPYIFRITLPAKNLSPFYPIRPEKYVDKPRFIWYIIQAIFCGHGPLVKRLRQRPLTPLTWVRFPHGSPKNTPAYAGVFFRVSCARNRTGQCAAAHKKQSSGLFFSPREIPACVIRNTPAYAGVFFRVSRARNRTGQCAAGDSRVCHQNTPAYAGAFFRVSRARNRTRRCAGAFVRDNGTLCFWLYPLHENTPRAFRVFSLSTLGVAYQRSTGLHIFYFACLLAAWRLGRGMEHTMAMPRARATATFKVSMPLLVHRARSLRKK